MQDRRNNPESTETTAQMAVISVTVGTAIASCPRTDPESRRCRTDEGDAGQGDAGQTKQPPINRDNGANGGYFGHGRDSCR
jgi:hypothetical protein